MAVVDGQVGGGHWVEGTGGGAGAGTGKGRASVVGVTVTVAIVGGVSVVAAC